MSVDRSPADDVHASPATADAASARIELHAIAPLDAAETVKGGDGGDHIEQQKGHELADGVDTVSEEPRSPELVDQSNILPRSAVIKCFIGLDLIILLAFLDQTVVATLLPTLSRDLNGGNATVWVASVYLLTSSITVVVSGRLSDVFGRKAALLGCVAIFFVWNAACSVAQTINQLIVFRALLGLGGGALISLTMVVIEAVIIVGNAGGPLLGGVFAESNWRGVFWMQLPLCAIAFVLVGYWLPLKRVEGDWRRKIKQVDFVGILLVVGASVMVLLALNLGGVDLPWNSATVLSLLIIGSSLFFVLAAWEYVASIKLTNFIAIIPHRIFVRTVTAVLIVTYLNGSAFLSISYFIPQYLQIVFLKSPIISGLLILPWLLTVTASVTLCGFLTSRYGVYRPFILVGFALYSVGLGLLSTVDGNSSLGKIAGFEVIGGSGMGMAIQTSLIAAQAAVPRSDMAVVTSSRNFMRVLGGAVALAISQTVVNNHISSVPGLSSDTVSAIFSTPTTLRAVPQLAANDALLDEVLQAYTVGFQRVFQINAGYTTIAFLASLFIQHHTLNRADDAKRKEEGRLWLKERQEARRRKKSAATKAQVASEAQVATEPHFATLDVEAGLK